MLSLAPDTASPSTTMAVNTPTAVFRYTVPSPIGALTIFAQDDAITEVLWAVGKRIRNPRPTALLTEAAGQLSAYFAGKLQAFDLPLAPKGTPFRERAWSALCEIPYGTTESYGMLARRIGSSPRAVGGACGANPIPILIPCHRVLGGGGALHGYSGGHGISTKARLLALEGVRPAG